MFPRITVIAVLAALALATPAAQGAFPGANGKIAFSSERSGEYQIYTMAADGSAQTLIPRPESSGFPAWSQDGRRLAFSTGFEDSFMGYEIRSMNADGSGESFVYGAGGLSGLPAWSPDGSEVALTDMTEGCDIEDCFWYPELLIAKADGSSYRIPDRSLQPTERAPSWSPSASWVAFDSQQTISGELEIQLIRPDGTDRHSIGITGQDPNWSPDGSRFAFYAFAAGGGNEIFTANADGSNIVRLTHDPAPDLHPAWSPDGRKIVFERYDGTDWEIVSMNSDGSGQQQLTNNTADDLHPDWQPLRAIDRYPRPGGATPLLVSLVPAYRQCTAPNSQHVTPLAEGSCEPPAQVSSLLTTSRIGQGQGRVTINSVLGNVATPADEADFKIRSQLSDVRKASDQSDYTGQVLLTSTVRITDRASGFGGVSATVSDFRFDMPIACTASVPASNGSDCSITTSADALVAGMIREGKRSVISMPRFAVLDAGPDGALTGPSCPPTCGTGDEEIYLEQGTFAP